MDKQARHFAIKEIITTRPIFNQDDLRLELRKRSIKVTQATLSRDLKELGVSRVVADEKARYVLQGRSAEMQILKPIVGSQVVAFDSNESLIVVKTLPGSASTVGEFIDSQQHPDIIGTVAGDNTLLIVPRSIKKTGKLLHFLREKLIEGK